MQLVRIQQAVNVLSQSFFVVCDSSVSVLAASSIMIGSLRVLEILRERDSPNASQLDGPYLAVFSKA